MSQRLKVFERFAYFLPWQDVSRKVHIDIRSGEPVTLGGITFIPNKCFQNGMDYSVLVVIQANIDLDLLAHKAVVLQSQTIPVLIERPEVSVVKNPFYDLGEFLIKLSPGSKSLVYKPLFPSFRRAAYCLEIGEVNPQKYLSANINLVCCNTNA